ncbi:MAG TPA: VanZ family protein, partial [Leptolinea sp.]
MKLIRIITLLFFLALVWIVLTADFGSMPPFIYALYHYPNGDKLGHFLLFGLLAFLVNLSLSGRMVTILKINIPMGSLLIAGFAAIEEFSQIFFPSRTASLLDLASSLLG